MNEFLTQHFLSMKWDKNYINALQNTSISEDTVVSKLDAIMPEWSSEITHLTEIKGEMAVAISLYLPGKILTGIGNSDINALCNIINRLTSNVNTESVPNSQMIKLNNDNAKQTTATVLNQLEQIKANVQNKQQEAATTNTDTNDNSDSSTNILDDLLSMSKSTTEQPVQPVVEAPQQEEEKEIIFGTPEAEAYEKQFWDQVNGSSPVPATPEGMNPNMEFMQNKWTPEQGTKLKAWMAEHNVTKKEEMSAWFKRYCGLEYDYFNPIYVDNFITWAQQLREKQTY